MNGLTPFLLAVIMAVTIAQIAGNNKRAKDKFEKGLKKKITGPAQLLKKGETKIDASHQTRTELSNRVGPSFEADGKKLPRTEITDDNNPFEV